MAHDGIPDSDPPESGETVTGRNFAVRPDQIAMLVFFAKKQDRSVSWLLRQIIDASPQMQSYSLATAAWAPAETVNADDPMQRFALDERQAAAAARQERIRREAEAA